MNTTIYGAKSGFVICSTPGVSKDERFPLSSKGIEEGRVERAFSHDPMALFETQRSAEEAMALLVPEGSTPASYAGLTVENGWQAAPDHMGYGWVKGHGFEPIMEPRG